MRARVALLLTTAACVAAPATAGAALAPGGCVADNSSGVNPCPTTAPGLQGALGIAVAPDGGQVFTGTVYDSSLLAFARDRTAGAATFQECWETRNPLFADFCGGQRAEGLGFAGQLAVTRDGRNVYVAGGVGNAVVAFARDATGGVDYLMCVSDRTANLGEDNRCDDVNQEGLEGVEGVAVTPDGANVYAAGFRTASLVALQRDTTTGRLTPAGCFKSPGGEFSFGGGTSSATCAGTAPGLRGPNGVAISPDGRSVYVTSLEAGSVTHFRRDATPPHALTPAGCISATATVAPGFATGCTTLMPSLRRPEKIAVSGDGRTVTVAGASGPTVLSRHPDTGALSFAGCLIASGSGDFLPACTTYTGSAGGQMTLSADGRNAYVASAGRDTVLEYARNTTTGALTYVGCVRDPAFADPSCSVSQAGLRSPTGLAVSPDGLHLYVAAGKPFSTEHFGSVAWLARTPSTAPPTPPPSVPAAIPVSADGAIAPTLVCPTGALEYCRGELTVTPSATPRAAAGAARITIAKRTTRSRLKVRVKLPAALRRGAGKRRGARARVRIVRINPNGTRTTKTRTVRLVRR